MKWFLLFFFVCSLFVLECVAVPEQIHIAVANFTNTQIAVSWVTKLNTATSIVRYGVKSGTYNLNATGYSHTYTQSGWHGWIHDVIITGLAGATRYYYIVGDSTDGWSAEFSFLTKPPASANINVVAIGDMSTSSNAQRVLTTMKNYNYDLLIFAGDLSYANGDNTTWDKFFNQIQPHAANKAWMYAIGNHESTEDYNMVPYLNRVILPNNKLWYSFDFGPLHVLSFSTENPTTTSSAQYQYIRGDLQQAYANRNNVPWIVVTAHKPMYTANTNHPSEIGVRQSIEPLLLQYHVDLAIWGHNHCYERTYPVNATRVQNSQTKVYNSSIAPIHLVVGAAGQSLYQSFINPTPAWSLYREAVFGYSRFHIDSTQKSLHFQFLRTDESVADEFWICKNPSGKCPVTFASTIREDVIKVGSSWKFSRVSQNDVSLHHLEFDDSTMLTAATPFVFPATPAVKESIGGYLFRKTLDVSGIIEPIVSLSVSIAAENRTLVYVNGVMVDGGIDDPEQDFPYWNNQFFVNLKLIKRFSPNVITMYMAETGDKAFFDAEVFVVKEKCMTGSVWNEEINECI